MKKTKQISTIGPGHGDWVPSFKGELFDWFETGTEGVIWALLEEGKIDYAGLKIIKEGDSLIIFDRRNRVRWQGVIKCDRKVGRIPRPTNPQFKQQTALGLWVHWIQSGFKPDVWARFFVRREHDRFHGVLVPKNGARKLPAKGASMKTRRHQSSGKAAKS